MAEFWYSLPVDLQDALIFCALLTPLIAIAMISTRGYNLRPLLFGMMRRHGGICALFVLLIAVSVAVGVGVIAQERGLRKGSARAADKFDLVIAAPGNEIAALLASVYLQPSNLPLLSGEIYTRVATNPNVELAAPLAFGDSWDGRPVVGTTAAFIRHLGETLNDGRMFRTPHEAVIGADVPLSVGDRVEPIHGMESFSTHGQHGFEYSIVGQMPPTGSPWDTAILVPVESVWETHGQPNGHPKNWDGKLGAPFDPDAFPGTPAIVVRASQIAASYTLQRQFTTDHTMAFFPGSVLSQLHAIMGDIRDVMSKMTTLTQILVAAAVLAGLSMLISLLAPRLALLRAMGAPRRFIFALTWGFAMSLIVIGAGFGLVLGVLSTGIISKIITAKTQILVTAHLGWPEFHLIAAFLSTVALCALIPAFIAMRGSITDNLRR